MRNHLAIGGPIDGKEITLSGPAHYVPEVPEVESVFVEGSKDPPTNAPVKRHTYHSHVIKTYKRNFFLLVHESLTLDEAIAQVFNFYIGANSLR